MPGDGIPSFPLLQKIHFDKIVHFGMYFVLAFSILFSFFYAKEYNIVFSNYFVVWLICTVYGLLMEALQLIPALSRSFEFADFLVNSAGAVSGCLLFFFWNRYRNRK
jgi:VanZ family protein